jgi:hypothetical protein
VEWLLRNDAGTFPGVVGASSLVPLEVAAGGAGADHEHRKVQRVLQDVRFGHSSNVDMRLEQGRKLGLETRRE